MWLGYGYLLGMLTTTVFMRLLPVAGVDLLMGVLGLSAFIGLAVTRRLALADVGYAATVLTSWQRVIFGLLLLLLLVRYGNLGYELWLRPLTPWDAWTTWGLRARVWTELGERVPFVSPTEWLRIGDDEVYTTFAWHYPETVSLIQSWTASAWGSWHAGAANLPWLGAALALALGLSGQARRAGVSPLCA
ncbi:MAG: hypothetical protein R3202_02055, partial [Candidatus Competibacterales bacterium]|nr:hypothetical protein [Candidatus Competibacterales bacterium]